MRVIGSDFNMVWTDGIVFEMNKMVRFAKICSHLCLLSDGRKIDCIVHVVSKTRKLPQYEETVPVLNYVYRTSYIVHRTGQFGFDEILELPYSENVYLSPSVCYKTRNRNNKATACTCIIPVKNRKTSNLFWYSLLVRLLAFIHPSLKLIETLSL